MKGGMSAADELNELVMKGPLPASSSGGGTGGTHDHVTSIAHP